MNKLDFNNSNICYINGRYNLSDALYLYNSVSGVYFVTDATYVVIDFDCINYRNKEQKSYISFIVDDERKNECFEFGKNHYELLLDGKKHLIKIQKVNEAIDFTFVISSIGANGEFYSVCKKQRKIEVIGDSTTAGYGVFGKVEDAKVTSNCDGLQDFAYLAAGLVDAECHVYSASGWGAKASIWTEPKEIGFIDYLDRVAVKQPIKWDHSKYEPDLLIFSIGTNDMIYIEEKDASGNFINYDGRMKDFLETYEKVIEYEWSFYPNAKVLLVYGCMQEKHIYEADHLVYESLKKKHDNVYELELCGDLLGCGTHPSVASHHDMSLVLADYIKKIMNW